MFDLPPAGIVSQAILHPSDHGLISSMADQEQLEEFLGGLEALGGSSGNGRLRGLLDWDEASYESVKAALIEKGALVQGRGRGGSVSIAGAQTAPRRRTAATAAASPPRTPRAFFT